MVTKTSAIQFVKARNKGTILIFVAVAIFILMILLAAACSDKKSPADSDSPASISISVTDEEGNPVLLLGYRRREARVLDESDDTHCLHLLCVWLLRGDWQVT